MVFWSAPRPTLLFQPPNAGRLAAASMGNQELPKRRGRTWPLAAPPATKFIHLFHNTSRRPLLEGVNRQQTKLEHVYENMP